MLDYPFLYTETWHFVVVSESFSSCSCYSSAVQSEPYRRLLHFWIIVSAHLILMCTVQKRARAAGAFPASRLDNIILLPCVVSSQAATWSCATVLHSPFSRRQFVFVRGLNVRAPMDADVMSIRSPAPISYRKCCRGDDCASGAEWVVVSVRNKRRPIWDLSSPDNNVKHWLSQLRRWNKLIFLLSLNSSDQSKAALPIVQPHGSVRASSTASCLCRLDVLRRKGFSWNRFTLKKTAVMIVITRHF